MNPSEEVTWHYHGDEGHAHSWSEDDGHVHGYQRHLGADVRASREEKKVNQKKVNQTR